MLLSDVFSFQNMIGPTVWCLYALLISPNWTKSILVSISKCNHLQTGLVWCFSVYKSAFIYKLIAYQIALLRGIKELLILWFIFLCVHKKRIYIQLKQCSRACPLSWSQQNLFIFLFSHNSNRSRTRPGFTLNTQDFYANNEQPQKQWSMTMRLETIHPSCWNIQCSNMKMLQFSISYLFIEKSQIYMIQISCISMWGEQVCKVLILYLSVHIVRCHH